MSNIKQNTGVSKREKTLQTLCEKRKLGSSDSFKLLPEAERELCDDPEIVDQISKDILEIKKSGVRTYSFAVGYFLLKASLDHTFELDASVPELSHVTLENLCKIESYQDIIVAALRTEFGQNTFQISVKSYGKKYNKAFASSIFKGFQELLEPPYMIHRKVGNVIAKISQQVNTTAIERNLPPDDLFYVHIISLVYSESPYYLLGLQKPSKPFVYPLENYNPQADKYHSLILEALWDDGDENKIEYLQLLSRIATAKPEIWEKFIDTISTIPCCEKAFKNVQGVIDKIKQGEDINQAKLEYQKELESLHSIEGLDDTEKLKYAKNLRQQRIQQKRMSFFFQNPEYQPIFDFAEDVLYYWEQFDFERLIWLAKMAVSYTKTYQMITSLILYGEFIHNSYSTIFIPKHSLFSEDGATIV